VREACEVQSESYGSVTSLCVYVGSACAAASSLIQKGYPAWIIVRAFEVAISEVAHPTNLPQNSHQIPS